MGGRNCFKMINSTVSTNVTRFSSLDKIREDTFALPPTEILHLLFSIQNFSRISHAEAQSTQRRKRDMIKITLISRRQFSVFSAISASMREK